MPDKQSKSIGNVLAEFSKKISRVKDNAPEQLDEVKVKSSLKPLQDQINERENEKAELLRRQFLEYVTPRTADIEQDEDNLITAYKLFCALLEANDNIGDNQTRLKDFSITSPLCKKSEYTTRDGRFSFLLLWFISTNPDSEYIPQMTALPAEGFVLTFVEKEMWEPTFFEKEILQLV